MPLAFQMAPDTVTTTLLKYFYTCIVKTIQKINRYARLTDIDHIDKNDGRFTEARIKT